MISCFKYFVILVVYFLSNLVFAGPGRSGGENGIITDPAHIQNSIHAIDIIETDKIKPIHDFEKELPGFSSFTQLLTKLKNFNSDLPEYLSEVFTKKQWYFIDTKINNAQCENGTLLDTAPENKIIIVCQFQDKVFVNKKDFPSSSLSQLTLLVHEGLVNQMLKYLISIENNFTSAQVDKLQKNIEVVIHRISVKLVNLTYVNLAELKSDLKEASLPLLYSDEEKKNLYISPKNDQFILSKDYYIGASEKLKIMKNLFETANTFKPDLLRKKYGLEACLVNYSGSSLPGYWVGAYLKLDDYIPELLFTTQVIRFDAFKFDEKKLLQTLKEKIALTPLQKTADGHWSGQITFSIDAIEKVIGEAENNMAPKDKDYFLKYAEYQRSLGSQRLIQLDIRQINDNSIIIRRLVYAKSENTDLKLIDSDYGFGSIQTYPTGCMSEH